MADVSYVVASDLHIRIRLIVHGSLTILDLGLRRFFLALLSASPGNV